MAYSNLRRICLSLSLLLILALPAAAQFGAGIQGVVTDQTGAVVKAAKVTVTNDATGVASTVATSDSGFYSVQMLPPGKYTVSVEAASFQKASVHGVEVGAESPRGLNVVLKPGQVQESVTVTAEAPLLQTENGSIAGNIDAQQVTQLSGAILMSSCGSLPACLAILPARATRLPRFFLTSPASAAPVTPSTR